ncbi:MAG: hypothetical protein ABUK11_07360 [Mariprofundaceae bacterium]
MTIRILSTPFILCALLLIPLAEAVAEANIVPLGSMIESGSLQSDSVQSKSARISAESMAALIQKIRYKKQGFISLGDSKKLFSNFEADELSKEIAPLAASLQSRQAIAFVSDKKRVKGQLLFFNHQILWHISSVNSRPAERITRLVQEHTSLDDSDSSWENTIEESYWRLDPQKEQSLYQNRPDWLLMEIRHVAVKKESRKSDAPTLKSRSQSGDDTDKQWSRIETLHRLAEKGLITPAEYNSKISEVIAEQRLAHPAIDEQMELLQRLHQKKWIDEKLYRSHRKALLESL